MYYFKVIAACIYGEKEAMEVFLVTQKVNGSEVFTRMQDHLTEYDKRTNGREERLLLLRAQDVTWPEDHMVAWEALVDDASKANLEHETVILWSDVYDIHEQRSEDAEGLISIHLGIDIEF